MKRNTRNRRRRGFPPVLAGLIVISALTLTSYGIASAWQKAEDQREAEKKTSMVPDGTLLLHSDTDETDVTGEDETSQEDTADSGQDALNETEPSSGEEGPDGNDEPEHPAASAARAAYPYALPDTGFMVEKSYFDDAIFFGDSISVGIPLYGVMPNAQVIAVQGISTVNASTSESVEMPDGTRATMLDAAAQYGEKSKVYIMLGGNGLGYEKDAFISGYRDFLKAVKAQYPSADIYVQSMLPVTRTAHLTYPSVSNEKIDEYNLAIMNLAKELGVYYVDVAAALVDEEGVLPTEASPSDGMHLTGPYYFKWFDYLRSHTAQK